jgi:hypothetical protein
MRDGETVASIQMRAEQDRVMLIYRYRSGDAEWKDEQYAHLYLHAERRNVAGVKRQLADCAYPARARRI